MRRATEYLKQLQNYADISIHALREESDVKKLVIWSYVNGISIHALREESDPGSEVNDKLRDISIHALREESDAGSQIEALGRQFISIHALREESDLNCCFILRIN